MGVDRGKMDMGFDHSGVIVLEMELQETEIENGNDDFKFVVMNRLRVREMIFFYYCRNV